MSIELKLIQAVKQAVKNLYRAEIENSQIQIQETRKEFTGDLTVVVFPIVKLSRKSPEITGEEIGKYLVENISEVSGYSIVKGFLNISISDSYWLNTLTEIATNSKYGTTSITAESKTVMLEYSSPNTNKPLHLGHIRNNLLGYSVANILKANGNKVVMANLVNDRGIHICKSMLAWQKWGNGETPESTGKKGDHLVGDYYVKFDIEYKKQIKELVAVGLKDDEAEKTAPIILEAQDMLRKWEAGDKETVDLWKTMNGWVYKGFDETYLKMGVSFDKIYYESETYLLGKEIVNEGLAKKILFKKPDNSVWADLTLDGLDQKLLLRSDGTSVYMTQDLGTACQRFAEYKMDELVYVVGNEQNYHFQVLSLILQKLGYSWAKKLIHLSYGMVELPSGKMKSREGTVVDADDLIEEMIKTAREMSQELGKLEGYTTEQAENIFRIIGLGALKYFILKVDPKKNMMFDPKESIDFNGNTGPFIQYTYARIQSVLRKATEFNIAHINLKQDLNLDEKEKQLLKSIYKYPTVVKEAGDNLSPALIANYIYDLAKEYNQFYHESPILKVEDLNIKNLRLTLTYSVGMIIESGMALMGIEVPERM